MANKQHDISNELKRYIVLSEEKSHQLSQEVKQKEKLNEDLAS